MILTVCILLVGNISAQQPNHMERKFDIKKFKENRVDGEYRFRLNDTTEVVQSVDGNEYYLETLIFNGSEKEKGYAYYYDSGQLASEVNTYCNELVGISRTYNIYGELVQEIDWDKGFAFSMEDLRDLIKKMFKKDILYPETKSMHSIQRFNDEAYISKEKYPNAISIYMIQIATYPKPPKKSHLLVIDGMTGEILSHIDENGNELISKHKDDTCMNDNDKRNWTPLID